VRKAAFDALITSGMTVRSCNESVLNGHVECIAFSELNNGDMAMLTRGYKTVTRFVFLLCLLFNDAVK
jgi:hypothetical protein